MKRQWSKIKLNRANSIALKKNLTEQGGLGANLYWSKLSWKLVIEKKTKINKKSVTNKIVF